MKRLKKILALAIAMAMVVAMSLPAMAASYGEQDQAHTITIAHNEATGAHTYSAYQIFKGNLDAQEGVLSDIQWGSSVSTAGQAGIISDLQTALATETSALYTFYGTATVDGTENTPVVKDKNNNVIMKVADITTAADVAKVVSLFDDDSKALDAFAQIAAKQTTPGTYDYLGTAAGNGSIAKGADNGTINVAGDGYYMIIDDTTTLADGDTYSKIMLNVVKDVTVKVKDDSIKPDKEIVEDGNNDGDYADDGEQMKANTSAVGDTVTYQVKVTIPDTTNYNFYKFVLKDQLPAGLTFKQIESIVVDDGSQNGVPVQSTTSTTNGIAGTYVLTATTTKDGEGKPTGYAPYTAPADMVASGTGGQAIKIVFNKFKEFVERDSDATTAGVQDLIGKEIVVTYSAIVNADATYGAEYNENTVKFDFTNNPNYQYDGNDSDFTTGEPQGSTPEDKTQTYVTTLEILKYTTTDGTTKNGLAGAEFEITSDAYNAVVKSGTKYVTASPAYTLATGEAFEKDGTNNVEYYKLKDGSYTTAVPGAQIKDASGNLLYIDGADKTGATITTSETYVDDDGVTQNNVAYVYNTTQYDSITTKYNKVIYTVVDKTPATVSGNNKKYTVVSGNDGKINLNGLQPGVYTIEETHAPDGYNKIDTKYELTIAWVDIGTDERSVATTGKTADEVIAAAVKAELDALKTVENLGLAGQDAAVAQAKANGGFFVAKAVAIDGNTRKAAEAGTFVLTFTHEATTTPTATPQDNGGKYKIDILNQKGTELPSTGGIGTTIFYVVGAILVIGAGVVLITKRRMDA